MTGGSSKRLLLAAAAIVAALGVAEGAHRLWLRSRDRAYDAEALRGELLAQSEPADWELPGPGGPGDEPGATGGHQPSILHPYLAWFRAKNVERLQEDLAEARTADASRYEVLILGGSVAAGFGNRAADRLVELLERDPRLAGREVVALRYGVAAFKQPQQLYLLHYLTSLGLSFDAVLNLDGFNELALTLRNHEGGYHPVYPSFRKWLPLATDALGDPELFGAAVRLFAAREELTAFALEASEAPGLWSSLVGARVQSELERRRGEVVALQDAYVERVEADAGESNLLGLAFEGGASEAVAFGVRSWSEASHSMHLLCEARGIDYVHVLQPTLHDAGSKTLLPIEVRGGAADPAWIEGVRLGYDGLRAAGAELAERGVRFLDASGTFRDVEERIYVDVCHYVPLGYELVAEAAAAFLLERASLQSD